MTADLNARTRTTLRGRRRLRRDVAIAARLAAALDDAASRGRWRRAARLAGAARVLAPRFPRLVERVARLHLLRREPAQALAVLEAARCRSDGLLFLRTLCLMTTGRRPEAQLELRSWCRRGGAPEAAHLLLALLSGPAADERVAVPRRLLAAADGENVEALVLLVLAAVERGSGEAVRWARRLRDGAAATDRQDMVTMLLGSLLPELLREPAPPGDGQVERLARELVPAEPIIPALVEAQRLQPRPADAALLRRAIERALPALSRPVAACESLARLLLVEGDAEAALRWANLAARSRPMSAAAALLVETCREALAPAEPATAPIRERAA